ncbi:Similar to elp2: Elongator complex protein 2 (Xenopus tropicalis) [Cotesia congregata]|uniref:Elongator complex protein 2 n=1 Tax=Cotesia congregata TaxID=51543 RepID=A0A8J2MX29_COTCN|nr:Similar to elp2: Elongator complex protein 2 (Xenopus tropicalis) [Cotesia congregata]
MQVKTNYISCALNRGPHAIDWCRNNNIICYASFNSVVIYDLDYLETGRVIDKLEKHESRVKVVNWICKNNSDDCSAPKILSASEDGTIIIWDMNLSQKIISQVLFILETAHAAYCPNPNSSTSKNNDSLLITGSSCNCEFKIYEILIDQKLDLKKKLVSEIKISSFPGDKPIPVIIICLEKVTIDLYTCNSSWLNKNSPELNFNHTIELHGPQDWIKLTFMASGSRDGTIRLWKISSIPPEAVDDEQPYQFKPDNKNHLKLYSQAGRTKQLSFWSRVPVVFGLKQLNWAKSVVFTDANLTLTDLQSTSPGLRRYHPSVEIQYDALPKSCSSH